MLRAVSAASRASVAAKVRLVGGRECSLCAHSRENRDQFRWWLFAAIVDFASWIVWPVNPVHTQDSWEWWK